MGSAFATRLVLPLTAIALLGLRAETARAQPHQVCLYLDIGDHYWDASFGEADLDYCYDPAVHPAAPNGCPPNHTMESHEWQAAAAIEGIASWYAVSVWNDVDLVECQSCQPGVRYVSPSSESEARTFAVPRGEPLCTTPGLPPCLAGVGNEWDWLSAFRLFRLSAAPGFRVMFTMLSAAYATGAWAPRAADASFWTNFDQAMVAHLGPHHAAWLAAAEAMELDR